MRFVDRVRFKHAVGLFRAEMDDALHAKKAHTFKIIE